MMFARLAALRDKLASVPAFAVDADTRRQLIAAIDELDDAMVEDTRLENYKRTLPPAEPETIDQLLARFANAPTMGVTC